MTEEHPFSVEDGETRREFCLLYSFIASASFMITGEKAAAFWEDILFNVTY